MPQYGGEEKVLVEGCYDGEKTFIVLRALIFKDLKVNLSKFEQRIKVIT